MKQPNKFTFWDLKQVWAWDYSILANEKKKKRNHYFVLLYAQKIKRWLFSFHSKHEYRAAGQNTVGKMKNKERKLKNIDLFHLGFLY